MIEISPYRPNNTRLGALLILTCSAFAACAGLPHVPPDQIEVDPHIAGDFLAWRADTLGISLDAADARDATFPEDQVPEATFWDSALQQESAGLWRDLCAKCHGPEGDPDEAEVRFDPSPRDLGSMGMGMGFFFGGDKMRAGIYRRIKHGGEPREGTTLATMPAFGDSLSREQIWGLVFHVEGM